VRTRLQVSRRGSAITEFALCSTVLILMFMGGTDMARVFNLGTSMTQAAKAGAQFASFSSQNAANTSGIIAAAQAAAPSITMTITTQRVCYCGAQAITCGSSCQTPPSMYTQVKADGVYDPFLPFWGSTSAIPVAGTARVRVK
jgi:Flp pilus assembly protein TadG